MSGTRRWRDDHRAGSVEVIKADWTGSTYALSTIDQFEADTLEVTSRADGMTMARYPPGTWREATVYDAQGYPDFTFTSQMEVARRAAVLGGADADHRG